MGGKCHLDTLEDYLVSLGGVGGYCLVLYNRRKGPCPMEQSTADEGTAPGQCTLLFG